MRLKLGKRCSVKFTPDRAAGLWGDHVDRQRICRLCRTTLAARRLLETHEQYSVTHMSTYFSRGLPSV